MPRIKDTPKQSKRTREEADDDDDEEEEEEEEEAKGDNLIERTKTQIFKLEESSLQVSTKPMEKKICVRKRPKRVKVTSGPANRELDAYFETYTESGAIFKPMKPQPFSKIKNTQKQNKGLREETDEVGQKEDEEDNKTDGTIEVSQTIIFNSEKPSSVKKTAAKICVRKRPKRVKVTSGPANRELDAYFETYVVPTEDEVEKTPLSPISDPFKAIALFSQAIANAGCAVNFPSIDFSLLSIPPPLGLKLPSAPQTLKPAVNMSPESAYTGGRYFLPEMLPKVSARERDKDVITCRVCEKEMRRGSLREHMDRHENSGKFECPQCNKTFSRASAREKHIRTHTGERPYACGQCDKSYRQKVHLNEHMRSHSGERPFVCRLCGFSVTSKSLLNRHLRTHGVEGKRAANEAPELWLRTDASTDRVLAAAGQVGASFLEATSSSGSSSNAVVTTALNATATLEACGRKHLCTECPAGFPTIQALRSHRATTHGLVVPHTCNLCPPNVVETDKTFSSLKAMRAHARKAHPQICPICDEVMPLRRRWVLEVHLREKHAGVSAESVIGPSPLYLGRVKKNKKYPVSILKKKKSIVSASNAETNGTGHAIRKKVIFEEDAVAVGKEEDVEVKIKPEEQMDEKKLENMKFEENLFKELRFHPVNKANTFKVTFAVDEESSVDSEGSIIQELRLKPPVLDPKTEPPVEAPEADTV